MSKGTRILGTGEFQVLLPIRLHCLRSQRVSRIHGMIHQHGKTLTALPGITDPIAISWATVHVLCHDGQSETGDGENGATHDELMGYNFCGI